MVRVKVLLLSFLMGPIFSLAVFAEPAPVEDLSQSVSADQTQPGVQQSIEQQSMQQPSVANDDQTNYSQRLPLDQRVTRLENQMSNNVQMNIPQQMADMQQKIQQLQGQLQEQQHQLQQLMSQQQNYYKDLDARINQFKTSPINTNNGKKVRLANSTPSDTENNSANDQDTASTTNIPNTKPSLNETNAYQNAFQLLTQKKFPQAKTGFINYIHQFPNGKFLANSHYWLGEIFMLEKNNGAAAKEFSLILQKFSTSPRVPDAKLKLAMIDLRLGKNDLARQEFLQIKKQYPDSTAAQLASIQVQQMDIEKP